jgi:polysaccharide biosynthesis/export protein
VTTVIHSGKTRRAKTLRARIGQSCIAPAGLLLLGLFVLGACAVTSVQPQADPVVDPRILRADEINRMNSMILSHAHLNSDSSDYPLGEGDLLRISVFEAPELDATVRVSARGLITLPLIGTVAVKGLTAIEAEEKIETLYQAGYIRNPHVSIFVEERVSQRITLVGQFKNPGTYDYPTKQRLIDVIALGGGLSEKAGQIVQIRQSRQVNGQLDVVMVDLERLISRGDVIHNLEINGGDVIFIPEAGVFFVDGAVRRPGAYAIKNRTVLQEALVEAGGLETWAVKDRVQLVRMAENGERKLIELDLSQAGVKELVLSDRDILIVPSSGKAGRMSGFGVSILGTGFSFYSR